MQLTIASTIFAASTVVATDAPITTTNPPASGVTTAAPYASTKSCDTASTTTSAAASRCAASTATGTTAATIAPSGTADGAKVQLRWDEVPVPCGPDKQHRARDALH